MLASVVSCSGLKESLQQSRIDNLLDFLSKKHDSIIRVKNQQIGEPDLTPGEKLGLLRTSFETNTASFLFRFGRHLELGHLDVFTSLGQRSFEVNFYLEQLRKRLSPAARKTQAKNRRYEALAHLVEKTDYFNEEEMQRRNPILYDQLIGRFHTKSEREAFLDLSAKSSSATGSDGLGRPTPLTDMLMAHMSHATNPHEGPSDRRIEQETQAYNENLADREYRHRPHRIRALPNGEPGDGVNIDDDDSEDEDEDDEMTGEAQSIHEPHEGGGEEIDDDEKELLKEEFFTTMYRSFLEGADADFDYSTVDDNPDYDIGETLDQDEEEKYFEAEEPAICQDEDNMTNGEDPIVTDEINGDVDVRNQTSSEGPIQNGIHMDDDEEDELDAYMKTIEDELSKSK